MNGRFLAVTRAYRRLLGRDLVSIVLFGSEARGEATVASDLDLFIVARNLSSDILERIKFLHELPIVVREGISVRGKTPEEFESYLAPMYLDLAVDGVILYDRDNYIAGKMVRIKQLLHQAGLQRIKREGEMMWVWDRPVKPGWELEWGGLVEVA